MWLNNGTVWGYRGVESRKRKWEIKILEQSGRTEVWKDGKIKVRNKNNGTVLGYRGVESWKRKWEIKIMEQIWEKL